MRITSWNFLHGQPLKPAPPSSTADNRTADDLTTDDLIMDEKEGVSAKKQYSDAVRALESDLIALQEVDFHLERSGDTNQSRDLAAVIKAKHWGFAPSISGTPGVKWRKLKSDEQLIISSENQSSPMSNANDGAYGIAIISKVPVKKWLRLELGRSIVGMPLLIGNEKGRLAMLYVKDEPRVAIAAVLDNGWTVVNTHLSFVPFVNIYQLYKLSRWAESIEREHETKVILLGDFNLPGGIPSKLTTWKRATESLSYPSWGPKISFDYILMREGNLNRSVEVVTPIVDISDHRPISIELELLN